jgi:tagatose 6-phosphate kinase
MNAAVDKTYRIPGFQIDHVHRPEEYWLTAGGKGVNVARVHHTMGGSALATGFAAGRNGRLITDSLTDAGIESDFVWTDGESRVCIAAIDPVAGTQTEINELGPTVSDVQFAALVAKVNHLLHDTHVDYLVLSGSLPPGVPNDAYAVLIAVGKKHGVRCVLDTSGEPLKLGVAAQPWMVKPNDRELAWLTGIDHLNEDGLVAQAMQLSKSGIDVVCVTRGALGAFIVADEVGWEASPPAIEFVSAVGSGDAFLGAMLATLLQGDGNLLSEGLRTGIGAGAANAETYGAGLCTREAVEARAAQTVVKRME